MVLVQNESKHQASAPAPVSILDHLDGPSNKFPLLDMNMKFSSLFWSLVCSTLSVAMFNILFWSQQQSNDKTIAFQEFDMPGNLRGYLTDAKEYVMWSHNETYQSYCEEHFLYNQTWGQELAPLVDKVRVKEILNEWNIPNVYIPKTIITFDEDTIADFTKEAFLELPKLCIFKGAHTSGRVARIRDGVFDCFKECPEEAKGVVPLSNETAYEKAHNLFTFLVENGYNEVQEPQYAFIEHTVVVEEHLPMTSFRDVTNWYIVGGTIIFVSLECKGDSDEEHRNYYTEDFRRLHMSFLNPACPGHVPKPGTWDTMRDIVLEYGSRLPRTIVRIDLYASETEVYFSEFSFTTDRCRSHVAWTPYVAAGLLTAVYTGEVDERAVTSEYVLQTIEGTSWSYVPLDGWTLEPNATHSYPSPYDLCSSVYKNATGEGRRMCIEKAKEVWQSPIRCLTTHDNGKMITSFGAEKYPTFGAVLESVEMDKVVILFLVAVCLTRYQIGTAAKRQNQCKNMVIFLSLMSLYMYLFRDNQGYFSPSSFVDVVRDSFLAFQVVHPMSSPGIFLSHVATYWFPIAAWRSKSLRNLVVWMLCYELIATFVTEFAHHQGSLNHVRCMRLAFIHRMKTYAFDEFIREYIVPTAFVYGYLLPTFLWQWLFGESIGHVVLLIVMMKVAIDIMDPRKN